MELLKPAKLSMLEWGIQEKYIIFWFDLVPHSLLHNFSWLLILKFFKILELTDPLFNQSL